MSDYLYLLLKVIELELDKKFFQGTGLKHLQKPLLKERTIYIPTEAERENFNSAWSRVSQKFLQTTERVDELPSYAIGSCLC